MGEVRSTIKRITEPISCEEDAGFIQAGGMVLRLKAFCSELGLRLSDNNNHSIDQASLEVTHGMHKAWFQLTEEDVEQIQVLMDSLEVATVECKLRFDELNIAQNEMSQQFAINRKELERLEKMILESDRNAEGIVEHWITACAQEFGNLGRVLEESISNIEQHNMGIHELECRNSFHDVKKRTAFWHGDVMPMQEVSTPFGRRFTPLELVAEVEDDELSDDPKFSPPAEVEDDGLSSQIEKLRRC